MENRQQKITIIEKGTFKKYKKQKNNFYNAKDFESMTNYKAYKDENNNTFDETTYKCCRQLKEAEKKQKAKIRNHYNWWLANNYQIFFGTFTYNDQYNKNNLDKIELARKLQRRVIRTIQNICDDYILNVDYGSQKERLHYHVLFAVKKDNLDRFNYITITRDKQSKGKYVKRKGKKGICKELLTYEKQVGFYDLEPCKDNVASANRLSNYINKLVTHSIKVKQVYISVKKATEYQRYLELNNAYYKEMKKAKREKTSKTLVIDNYFYLNNLRKYKNLVTSETYANNEYELLLAIQKEKDEKRKYIDDLKHKQNTLKVFDDMRTLESNLTELYNQRKNEIEQKYYKKVV